MLLVFQQIRHPKANKVVKMSWTMGKMAHLANPVLRFFHEIYLCVSPQRLWLENNMNPFSTYQIYNHYDLLHFFIQPRFDI